MAFRALVNSSLSVYQPISGGADALGAVLTEVLLNGFNRGQQQLSATTTVPGTLYFGSALALTAGAATIDFTALTKPGGGSQSASGLKLQILRAFNPVGNGSMTISPGASNGYEPFGASKSIVLPAGAELLLQLRDNLADVDGTHKTLDITGTGTQILKIEGVFG